MCDRAGVWVRVRVIAAHWDARLRPPTPFGRSPPSRHVAAGRREGPGGNLAAPAAAATRVRTGLEASRGYRFERAVSFRLAEHARRMAPSPACRKRPFTTQADRLRLPRQRRSAAAQLSKAYLPVNISVQERAAANVSWCSKSGSSA